MDQIQHYEGTVLYMHLVMRKSDFVTWERHRHRPACTAMPSDQSFVLSALESTIAKLAICRITIFKLVSVA